MPQSKPKTIPELFVARDKAINKATQNIFAAMPQALEAINELMGVAEIKKSGGELIWDEVEFFEEEQMIVMVGVIVFHAGCEVTTANGDKVKVTKDTEPYFRRLVRGAFPLSIASQSKDEVLAYFTKVQEDLEKQRAVDDLDRITEMETEFDLSTLTEDQLQAYQTSTMFKPGKA